MFLHNKYYKPELCGIKRCRSYYNIIKLKGGSGRISTRASPCFICKKPDVPLLAQVRFGACG